jgi:hypothetical protein
MNQVDYDRRVCEADNYGNVTSKKANRSKLPVYKGFKIDAGMVSVKVWTKDDKFIGRYNSIDQAKTAIDNHLH